MQRTTIFALLGTAAWCVIGPHAALADAAQCDALPARATHSLQIETATWVEAGPDEDAKADLPAHCRVTGVLDARTGAGDRAFGKRFELRMPDDWNHRFYFQGGGGLDGRVRPAVGSGQPDGNPPAVVLGYAVISTDGGHEFPDGSFGFDELARTEWGYQVIEDIAKTGEDSGVDILRRGAGSLISGRLLQWRSAGHDGQPAIPGPLRRHRGG